MLRLEAYDHDTDVVIVLGGAGYLIQQRLAPAPELAALFGPRLRSVRLLVLVTPTEPLIHRSVAKIATGTIRPTISGGQGT
jgi:hypothetical protein